MSGSSQDLVERHAPFLRARISAPPARRPASGCRPRRWPPARPRRGRRRGTAAGSARRGSPGPAAASPPRPSRRSTTSPVGPLGHDVPRRPASPRCRGPRSRSGVADGEGVVELGQHAGAEADDPMTPSSSRGAMPWLAVSAVTSTGSSSSTKRSVSASWTVMSSTTPAAGLGPVDAASPAGAAADRPRGRRGPPAAGRSRPAAIASRIARCVAALRRWWFVPMHDAGGAAGLDHLCASARVSASGFSHSTCLPARGGGQRLRAVQLVGGADVDGVDAGSASSSSSAV